MKSGKFETGKSLLAPGLPGRANSWLSWFGATHQHATQGFAKSPPLFVSADRAVNQYYSHAGAWEIDRQFTFAQDKHSRAPK